MAHKSVKSVVGCLVLFLAFFLLVTEAAPGAESDNAASLRRLGDQYISRGDYGNAVKAFEQAVRINPDDAAGYAGMGRGYLKLGANEVSSNPLLLEKGVDAFRSALRINPGMADARRDLGLTWLALGNRENALREQKALEKSSPPMAAELGTAIAASRPSPVYRDLGAGGGRDEGLTDVRIVGNSVLVPVTLAFGGQTAQVTLILDTGASVTAITPEVAARLGVRLDHAPVGRMRVADGRGIDVRGVRLDRIEAGPHSKTGMVVAVIPQHGPALNYDGLLGMDFLRNLNYHVDFRNRVINWSP